MNRYIATKSRRGTLFGPLFQDPIHATAEFCKSNLRKHHINITSIWFSDDTVMNWLVKTRRATPSSLQIVLQQDTLLTATEWNCIVLQVQQCKVKVGLNICWNWFLIKSIKCLWCTNFLFCPSCYFFVTLKKFKYLHYWRNIIDIQKNTMDGTDWMESICAGKGLTRLIWGRDLGTRLIQRVAARTILLIWQWLYSLPRLGSSNWKIFPLFKIDVACMCSVISHIDFLLLGYNTRGMFSSCINTCFIYKETML